MTLRHPFVHEIDYRRFMGDSGGEIFASEEKESGKVLLGHPLKQFRAVAIIVGQQ